MYKISDKCPFCGGKVIFTSNKKIYGKEYGNGKCYLCTNCNAYVGTHPTGNNDKPLGGLADTPTRVLRHACHELFDIVWKSRKITRKAAYKKLAELLDIPQNECHFGWMYGDMLIKSLNIMKDNDWYKKETDIEISNEIEYSTSKYFGICKEGDGISSDKKYLLSNGVRLNKFNNREVKASLINNESKTFKGTLIVENYTYKGYSLYDPVCYNEKAFIECNSSVGKQRIDIEKIHAIKILE